MNNKCKLEFQSVVKAHMVFFSRASQRAFCDFEDVCVFWDGLFNKNRHSVQNKMHEYFNSMGFVTLSIRNKSAARHRHGVKPNISGRLDSHLNVLNVYCVLIASK